MAKTKTETKTLERTYTIPLRKEYLKVPKWKRTNKAVTAVKKFLQKHMKSEEVKLGKYLNEKLWKHGIKNPPHHVKVTVLKDEKGTVKAELFGYKIEVKKKEEKKPSKLEEVAKKAGIKTPKKKEEKKEDGKGDKTPPPSKVKPEEKKVEEKPEEPKEKTEAIQNQKR